MFMMLLNWLCHLSTLKVGVHCSVENTLGGNGENAIFHPPSIKKNCEPVLAAT